MNRRNKKKNEGDKQEERETDIKEINGILQLWLRGTRMCDSSALDQRQFLAAPLL
jgi:hypothetical protein